MIYPYYREFEAIMVILGVAFLLWFISCESAEAQDRTDPVEMAHPVTNEPGAWIPRWLQRDHLETESKLNTCIEVKEKREQVLEKKNTETQKLRLALDREKKASVQVTTALAATEVQLEQAEETNNVLAHWLYGTSGVAIVAIGLMVVLAL